MGVEQICRVGRLLKMNIFQIPIKANTKSIFCLLFVLLATAAFHSNGLPVDPHIGGSAGSQKIHVSYQWHMHQPIYWPDRIPGGQRVQWAADSYDLKAKGFNRYAGSPYLHPRNNLAEGDKGEYDPIFSKEDRIHSYQERLRDSIGLLRASPQGGAQISFTGSLIDNIESFGRNRLFGYSPDWAAGLKEAARWQTSGGFSRANLIGINYHHSLAPLLPPAVLRKELQLFKFAWCQTWNLSSCSSSSGGVRGPKGYFPPEVAFSRRLIPILKQEGFEWSFVPAVHLARSSENFLDSGVAPFPGTGTWNTNPPNRADLLNPAVLPAQWWSGTLDGRGAKLPAPFAYLPHRVQYIHPETEEISELVVVPMDDVLGYMDGFGPMSLDVLDKNIRPYSVPERPPLVVLGHDGDNAWGGGYSYYMESVANTSRQAQSRGFEMTTVDQYLADHPVPSNDMIHVENGGWVNPEGDWGDPQFVKWLYPPARSSQDPLYNSRDPKSFIDIEKGFSASWRSWAIIIAGSNLCESIEQMSRDRVGFKELRFSEIREPKVDAVAAERCWHFFLAGLDSGFLYYGDSLDDEVKQSVAVSEAFRDSRSALDANLDRTPPSLLPPQRWPYNPGGKGWGVTTQYQPIGFNGQPPHSRDFYVWTLAHDVSGIRHLQLKYRMSTRGQNSMRDFDNETYRGGPSVGAWQTLEMQSRPIDPQFRGDPPSPNLDFFIMPPMIATHYWAKITGLANVLVDYYVEAVDLRGNRFLSDIDHVWVN